MGETSLLIFSLFTQIAIGTMLFTFLAEILYKDKRFKLAALVTAIFGVIGVFASFAHLGQPLSALNVLARFGQSWLSTEAVLAGIFAGVAVLYVLFVYLRAGDRGLSLALSGIGSVLGLVVVFSMAKVYSTTSAPIWQGINTFIDFYATTIALGALLFLATSISRIKDASKNIFGYSILAAVAVQAASAIPHALGLTEMGLAAQNSVYILNSVNGLVWAKWLLILGGAGVALRLTFANKASEEPKYYVGAFYTAGAALIVGQIIGRYLFYAALVVMNAGLV